jgi:hypothetical protein
MATILFAWELGAGLGHLTRMRPVAEGLARQGHRVWVAMRDLASAEQVFGGTGISYFQAPFKQGVVARPIHPASTFAHILHNIGFADAGELRGLTAAWRSIYALVQPDLIVADHSPTALLAARGLAMRRVVLGDGFCSPPDEFPLRDLRPWLRNDPAQLARDEQKTLGVINRVLASWGVGPLERVADLYVDVDDHLLTTFAELDHFGPREGANYRGAIGPTLGGRTEWPAAPGKRVFAYVRPFESLPQLISMLEDQGVSSLVYAPGADPRHVGRAPSGRVRFVDQPVDLTRAAEECDLAILNSSHGTTATMLLAGKPILQLPIHLEQQLVAERTFRLGAGLAANRTQPRQIAERLGILLESDRHAAAARQFANRYAGFDPARQLGDMVGRLEQLSLSA